jgi:DNA invertase Pin-like site-specific DNA recombinase
MKRAALYARVSTKDQNADMQIREMREFSQKRGFDSEEFVDQGHSGAKRSRPAFDRMMQQVKRRKFDVVIVWKFDRFARSLAQLVWAVDEFRALDVDFISLHDAADTTTPGGRLVFHIFGAIAEFERSLISERTRAGLAHAKAKGIRLGRRPVPVDIALIRSLRDSGKSWRAISRKLKIAPVTLQKAVLNGPRTCL